MAVVTQPFYDVERRLSLWLTPDRRLHPNTLNLVARFARALASKLAAAEAKYGYSDGWLSPEWIDECRAKLREHLNKGDPRDVAAYCAFLWHHGQSTKLNEPEPLRAQAVVLDPAFDQGSSLGERGRCAWAAYSAQDKQHNFGTTWESLGPERQACWMAAAAAAANAR